MSEIAEAGFGTPGLLQNLAQELSNSLPSPGENSLFWGEGTPSGNPHSQHPQLLCQSGRHDDGADGGVCLGSGRR